MGAYDDPIERLRQMDVMQQVLAALEKEPVTLLYAICKEYEASNEPVPDHHLPIFGVLEGGCSADSAIRGVAGATARWQAICLHLQTDIGWHRILPKIGERGMGP
jgi:hypothetical protein